MRVPRAAARRIAILGATVAALSSGCMARQSMAAEFDRIVEMLRLEPGMTVADVGAGDGRWSVLLARQVGDQGRVWATEVDADEIEEIEARVRGEDLENITIVLGDQVDVGLPEACCDAILLRMVYHHFTRPASMRASLRRSLRPGGRIAIIDITPQKFWRDLPEVPDRGGHGIPAEVLVAEMTADGFELVEREEDWNNDEDRYCVVFRR